ncbi:regulator [Maribacter sp. ANRC-HE7]|uniref:Regulator n=1 Tax=Maribacter aquimaris TaxID=2737171 RepID=A0ABR7V031_9FLAO|nr:regulator [Maribacter aquimaris]MBD0777911.1 regulator [Maribacter aquimaris]
MKIHLKYPTLLVLFVMLVISSWGFVQPKERTEFIKDTSKTYGDKNQTASEKPMPIYGNWISYDSKNGLPGDKAYCVKIDGDRVLVGTHEGLAVLENGNWKTYTTEDGLTHNGILAMDVDPLTGDVWLGTMGGLSRWSTGKFENYTQMNSGMPNDLIYAVTCDGKDVWVATGGGAGCYDTYTRKWEIFTEENAPMHEPWTYGVCASDDKIYIAAWGGGIIEYTKKTKKFRDYVDPDGNMEIDLFPDDGVVHDITTGASWSNGMLWVATYFGLSRYDGVHWKGYFDHDSGLTSNFINYIKAKDDIAFICTDQGLSTTDGKNWVNYTTNENLRKGKTIIINGDDKKVMATSPSLAHNFTIGVDVEGDEIWVATSKGVSHGHLMK